MISSGIILYKKRNPTTIASNRIYTFILTQKNNANWYFGFLDKAVMI